MRDSRPGLPLTALDRMETKRLYHFTAYDVLWTVQKTDGDYAWAALEPLPDNLGTYQSGDFHAFKTFFTTFAQYSPREIPERWQFQ